MRIYEPRTWHRHLWAVLAALLLLWVLSLWGASREGKRQWLFNTPWLLLLAANSITIHRGPFHLIHAGVWIVLQPLGSGHLIPLSAARIEATPNRWVAKWPEGRRRLQVQVRRDQHLDRLVTDALASIEHDEGPRTSAEAAVTVAIGTLPSRLEQYAVGGSIVAILGLIGLAYWQNHPLWLLPVCTLPYIRQRFQDSQRLVATPEGLYVLIRGQEPLPIPVADILRVESDRRTMTTVILTRSAAFPTLTLSEPLQAPIIKVLRRLTTAPTTAAPAPALPTGTPHCSLCGVPFTHLGKRDGAVLLCDTCKDRVRFEAQEGGHGLSGKERRPL